MGTTYICIYIYIRIYIHTHTHTHTHTHRWRASAPIHSTAKDLSPSTKSKSRPPRTTPFSRPCANSYLCNGINNIFIYIYIYIYIYIIFILPLPLSMPCANSSPCNGTGICNIAFINIDTDNVGFGLTSI